MRIPYDEMKAVFARVLNAHGLTEKEAGTAAGVFADNSLDGVYTHGYLRFARIVRYIDRGEINVKNEPTVVKSFHAFERWDGHRGLGPLNARLAMDRAIELSSQYGIGLVALGNNNHWLRGGSYGWQAADRGYAAICWSNTTANMPAWGARDARLGNNPLVMAVPRSSGMHVVVDGAMTQFSLGAIGKARLEGRQLPVYGGYDTKGNLTTDPAEIEKSGRTLPMGYWKGSGYSLLLDLIATMLTDGNSVAKIATFGDEIGLSQVMIAINLRAMDGPEKTDAIADAIIADMQSSAPVTEGTKIRYPGEREYATRKDNRKNGIPVIDEAWKEILSL